MYVFISRIFYFNYDFFSEIINLYFMSGTFYSNFGYFNSGNLEILFYFWNID